MAITPLPTPPSRADSANFAARGDALLSALPTFVTEANALQTDVNAKQVTASDAATSATAQATIATTKAGEAATSATAANDSKTQAAQSASDALLSKNAAATSATNAANSAASVDAQGFATDYAGATEPTIKWPYMTWADTTTTPLTIRRRNAGNTAWNGNPIIKAAPSVAADDVLVRSELPHVLLAEATISSAVAQLVLSWAGTSFRGYVLRWEKIVPVSGNTIQLQRSIDGGSSFITSANHYMTASSINSAGTGVNVGVSNATFMYLNVQGVLASTGQGTSGRAEFLDNAGKCALMQIMTEISSGVLAGAAATCWQSNETPINALRIYANTGNLQAGKVRIYGVR